MKRKLLLTANILGIIVPAVLILISLINIMVVGYADPSLYYDYDYVLSCAVAAVCVYGTVGTVSIFLSAISLRVWNGDKQAYAKMKGVTITALVFDYILSFFTFMELVSAVGFLIFIMFMLFGAAVSSAVLLTIDVATENGKWERLKAEQKKQEALKVEVKKEKTAAPEPEIEEILEVEDESNENDLNIDESIERINKLAELKSKGAISQSEFEQMKKEILGKFLKPSNSPKNKNTTSKSAPKGQQKSTAKNVKNKK